MATQKRFRSLRAYRRVLDELIAQARRGEIPWCEVNSAQSAIRGAADMIMGENLLKLQGIDVSEGEGEPDDGGLEDYHPLARAQTFRKKKVVVTRGCNAKGEPVDMQQVTVEGADEPVTQDGWFKEDE